jgi:predicted CXXCH cytochrome family protein
MNLTPAIFTLISLVVLPVAAARGDILTTKHNLSSRSYEPVHAKSEERICIFCHTPHHASSVTPLWSRPLSSEFYDLYASSTLKATPGQPTGASRLCLSCHDGTIALGTLVGAPSPIEFEGGVSTLPPTSSSYLGTNLSKDHPISFSYDSALALARGELKDPLTLPPSIKLELGRLECTACHDPHKDPYGKFLVINNAESALCVECHIMTGWSDSTHSTTAAIKNNGCGNCHTTHKAGGPRLLKQLAEENNCLPCHSSGGPSQYDVAALFASTAAKHPITASTGGHDPKENPKSTDFPYHVECVDCHNPHQAKAANGSAPTLPGSNKGVTGIDISGNFVQQASYEYEICFKCHGDRTLVANAAVPRQIEDPNERNRFSPDNSSFHPVAAIGRSLIVPSLKSDYTTASRIYCSDCHGSDTSKKAGASGPNGPHGSNVPGLLIAHYEHPGSYLTYSNSNYDLCYRCHDEGVILDPGRSAFPNHKSHVAPDATVDPQGKHTGKELPCSACHDPHGVLAREGTLFGDQHKHLINFDIRFVTSGSYDGTTRSCTVSCHSSNPQQY